MIPGESSSSSQQPTGGVAASQEPQQADMRVLREPTPGLVIPPPEHENETPRSFQKVNQGTPMSDELLSPSAFFHPSLQILFYDNSQEYEERKNIVYGKLFKWFYEFLDISEGEYVDKSLFVYLVLEVYNEKRRETRKGIILVTLRGGWGKSTSLRLLWCLLAVSPQTHSKESRKLLADFFRRGIDMVGGKKILEVLELYPHIFDEIGTVPFIFIDLEQISTLDYYHLLKKLAMLVAQSFEKYRYILKSKNCSESTTQAFEMYFTKIQDHEFAISDGILLLSKLLMDHFGKKPIITCDNIDTLIAKIKRAEKTKADPMLDLLRNFIQNAGQNNRYKSVFICAFCHHDNEELIFSPQFGALRIDYMAEDYLSYIGFTMGNVKELCRSKGLAEGTADELRPYFNGYSSKDKDDIFITDSVISAVDSLVKGGTLPLTDRYITWEELLPLPVHPIVDSNIYEVIFNSTVLLEVAEELVRKREVTGYKMKRLQIPQIEELKTLAKHGSTEFEFSRMKWLFYCLLYRNGVFKTSPSSSAHTYPIVNELVHFALRRYVTSVRAAKIAPSAGKHLDKLTDAMHDLVLKMTVPEEELALVIAHFISRLKEALIASSLTARADLTRMDARELQGCERAIQAILAQCMYRLPDLGLHGIELRTAGGKYADLFLFNTVTNTGLVFELKYNSHDTAGDALKQIIHNKYAVCLEAGFPALLVAIGVTQVGADISITHVHEMAKP